MAQVKKVLVIGRHAEMLTKVVSLLKQNGYNAAGFLKNEEAVAAFNADIFDAVVIGGGVDNESRNIFHSEFRKINPEVKIIDAHPSTILNDLKSAFPNE